MSLVWLCNISRRQTYLARSRQDCTISGGFEPQAQLHPHIILFVSFSFNTRVVPEVLFFIFNAECVPLLQYILDLCNREVIRRHPIPLLVMYPSLCWMHMAPDLVLSQRLFGTVCLGRHLLWPPAVRSNFQAYLLGVVCITSYLVSALGRPIIDA
jgi:hypothetical protein